MTTAVEAQYQERARARAGQNASLLLFLRSAIAAIDPDDLSRHDAGALIEALATSHERLIAGPLDVTRVVATPPAEAGAPLVLDIVCPDMPFIVDSTLAALRSMGGAIRLFAHPVLHVSGGQVVADGGTAVSMLHIQSDPVADPQALVAELETTLRDAAHAVADWQAMLDRVRRATAGLSALKPSQRDEAGNFVEWLTEHNFTFLGLREYRLEGNELVPVEGTGLGILRDENLRVLRSGPHYVESTPQLVAFVQGPDPLLVTKANVRSRVHRRAHMDYVGIKLFGADGQANGELRVVGLYTAQALATPHTDVPIIRRKIAEVMRQSGFDPLGHAGRTLLGALDSYPRDELFQIETTQLAEFAEAIAGLYDRPRVRVLPRIDRFDNFVSILVYVPRDRYDGAVRARITRYLADLYDGRVSAYYPHFPEGDLVRLHVIIGRNGGPTPQPERRALETGVEALTHDFSDMLMAAAPEPGAVNDWKQAFSGAYQSRNDAVDALRDIGVFQGLGQDGIAIRLVTRSGTDGTLGLKFYHEGTAIPLSDRVPMLEHFGFRVIDERTYTIVPRDGVERYLHDMVLELNEEASVDVLARGPAIEAGLLAVWAGHAESDQLNTLVTLAGLEWGDAALLRALSRYLRQVGTSYSQRYVAQVMVTQNQAARGLVALFAALHDPALVEREAAAEAARGTIAAQLELISSLDEDTIVRRFQNLIEASVRTNAWQRDADGRRRPALAIKFDSAKVDGMVAPRPYREISVYSPRVEGVHLRFGAIARGGIRWSDRPEDFRTEVLGLVKAQQVKNAVIVPVGAKGGFVPKRLSAGMAREAFMAEGTESYKVFIGALLDVTDNLMAGDVVPPANTVRRDGPDPYLVVAADKGTASFSDLANSIATGRGFWLGDAFASGGSAGYDHKKMGITARGGWEAVKRHFRELDRDIQKEPFTVAGVGDMSGDVFGNGMLLSPAIELVAAFDHRDIFIDPKPDAQASFAERERLFALPRSSWQDYERGLISAGGGVFSRSLKSIPLSAEMRALLGIDKDAATPSEVMRAILMAQVDLLWFGGIGTYIKAADEDDAKVGDRANDLIRISADQVRAKVVGEGANLGVTQRGRVAYALNGGRINTDAIDNSAGVNSSDLEVNIKIALAPVVASGQLGMEDRNAFLATMTDEVAALCLRNNYLQTLAISLAERAGLAELPDHRVLIEGLEKRGLLNRAVEFLPADATLDARAAEGKALTRPELAVILAYAKLTLFDDLLGGTAIDDPYLAGELFRYFPETLHRAYPEAVETHRLKREVIATVLANAMINRGGPAFVSELTAATSASAGEVALAYAAVRDAYGLTSLNSAIDDLDGLVPGAVQLALYAQVEALLRQEALWFLRNGAVTGGLAGLVARHQAGVVQLAAAEGLLPDAQREALEERVNGLMAHGVPDALARRIGELPFLSHASDIVLVAERGGVDTLEAARAYFGVAGLFDLFRIIEDGRAIVLGDRFDRMALDRALANLMRALRDLTSDVLSTGSLKEFVALHSVAVARTVASVKELTEGGITVSRLTVAAGLLTDLAREG
ncbi:NAD-glutamate dehydrogenase [Devosia sp. XJ19-1]|uniref:NAD-glutamate dehydrogenase n=1 Tax=Devosia ureilytica TaxID=2952754 RepID=A0A9Q4FTH2_9HYPH|nr:NAD-glutamate dehydrogenase [Devosia ureilytica]MCP8884176.1 NAD-glutamate dehydrogenase [Devosia ureilytica]MCP8887784.1 NAD-glutamate dehydrogenase [Devosia ureilytica]